MKVYVISEYYPFEGSDVVEVWDNQEAAEKRTHELAATHHGSLLINEYEVKGDE